MHPASTLGVWHKSTVQEITVKNWGNTVEVKATSGIETGDPCELLSTTLSRGA